ncbi:MAG: hypothetical protein JSS11_14935 [Verrucomicrobia bacterium]|nr:hypothetical protein [Verrucomicrobiota bacterium]
MFWNYPLYLGVGVALLAHLFFWGAGLAALITPRRWRRFWPVFALVTGAMLQSLVVWVGAYANLPGTDAYGRWCEVLPVILLAVAWRRMRFWPSLGKSLWMVLMMGASLLLITWPLSQASKSGLTTSSIGSCDAADYAAGARVLREFAHSDRSGFIGLTEVVSVRSTDIFFDFWLRLNHFTPSALMAFNGSVLGLEVYEVVGMLTAALLVATLPLVYWLARTLLRLRPRVALGLALLYGLSPVTWYAVYQVATGQLIAAQAIALLTWCGVVLWRQQGGWRAGLAFGGLLFAGYALLLGAYNFIVVVCLVPAAGFAAGCALWRGETRRITDWAVLMLAPLLGAALVSYERVDGLIERMSLFQQYDFGWRIPALGPEGWLGLVADGHLNAHGGALRWLLGAAVLALILAGWVAALKRGARTAFLAAVLCAPILAGYAYLEWRGVARGTNASYDAYKLFAVFYPGMLAAFGAWLVFAGSANRGLRTATIAVFALILGGNLYADWRLGRRMMTERLTVGRDLWAVQKLETLPEVTSLNMNIPEFWARLWANALLLHRPQYFATHTYEGRLNTALKGEWDLNGGLIRIQVPERDSFVLLSPRFSAVRRSSPHYLRMEFGSGWYDIERLARPNLTWRWSGPVANWRLENPQAGPLRAVLRLRTRGLVTRELDVFLNNRPMGRIRIGAELQLIPTPVLTLPPGKSVIELRCTERPGPASSTDARELGLMLQGVEVEVLPGPAGAMAGVDSDSR